jgi:hypothetical protein
LPEVIIDRRVELALGLEHAQISAFHNRFQALARAARRCPHRQAEGQAGVKLIVDIDEPVDVGDHRFSLALVGRGHQDREFIAADTCRLIGLEHGFAQHFASAPQQRVPGCVTPLVIGDFEPVEIGDDDRNREGAFALQTVELVNVE